MEEYESNSHKSKEKQSRDIPVKKVEKVVTGEVRTRKKSVVQKFADAVISDDISSVRNYIVSEFIMPALKNAISDAAHGLSNNFTNAVDTILFGKNGRRGRNSTTSRVAYGDYYNGRENRQEAYTYGTQSVSDYNYVEFDERGDAERVLDSMDEHIATYGIVSVADFYDMAGVSGDYTACKYGWTDIRGAVVVRVRNKYMIKFPKAKPLN